MKASDRLASKFWEKRRCAPITVPSPATGKLTKLDAQKEALVNESDITGEIVRLSGMLPYYRQIRDNAERAYKEARHEEYNTEENLYMNIRNKIATEGRKKLPTETELKMMIRDHATMKEAFRKRMEAEALLREMKSAVDSLEDKKFFLQALAKTMVAERGSEKDSF